MDRRKLARALALLALVTAACTPAQPAATPTKAPVTPVATPGPTATALPAGATPSVVTPTATPKPAPATPPAGAKPKYGGVLRAKLRTDPTTFEPHTGAADADGRVAHNLVFSVPATFPSTPETLCKAVLTPDAAESWRWVDEKTFEVKLKPGVKFQDKPPVNGRELTAEDAVYSFNRFNKLQTRASSVTRFITKVETVDKYTFRFRTDGPLPGIITSVLTSPWGAIFLAKESGGPKESWADPTTSWIGSGPFMFKEYRPGVVIRYEKNPKYWKPGLPYVDSLDLVIIPDFATSVVALRAGKVDLWPRDVPVTTMFEFLKSSPEMVQVCPPPISILYYMRTDQPPLNDVRVRRAISMAIDRDAIVRAVLGGQGVRSHVVAPAHPLFIPYDELPAEVKRWVEYRPEEAKKLLAEAGFPNGFEVIMNATTAYGSPHQEMTEAMMDMLGKVGIKMNIKWQERGAHDRMTASGEYTGMILSRKTLTDPWELLPRAHSQAEFTANVSHVNDPELDKLIDAFVVSLDEKEQARLARAIQFRMIEQAYQLQPAVWWDASLLQTYVKNFGRWDPRYSSTWAEITWLDK